MINPIANPDQFAAEKDVAAMWRTERLQAARAHAAQLFALAYGNDTPAEAHATFDAAIDEYLINYCFKAAASDPARSRFVRDFMPAYRWDGRDVPGARMGGDNPDNCYRLAGITHGARYRVIGRPIGPEPASTTLMLSGNWGTSVTIQTLDVASLRREDDGSFVVTINAEPAGDRPNHITTAPHAKFLFVRDSMEDWATETPFELEIERLDPMPSDPLTIAQLADRAAFRALEEVPLYYWFQRLFSGLPVNTVRVPEDSARLGGLVRQAGAQGWFQLADDAAVVVRCLPAEAAYVSVTLGDWWFRSIDAGERQSSLTRAQSVAEPDGSLRYVISRRDPGVANWLDTGDRDTVLFFARWQGLPANFSNASSWLEAKVVRFEDLATHLADVPRIDPAERAARLAARVAAWDRRVRIS